MTRLLDLLFEPARLRRVAAVWLVLSIAGFAAHLWVQTATGLTDGAGHPFGDDAITFWSGGRLAGLGRAREAYDFGRFHRFEVGVVGHEIELYNYAYPPLLLLLTVPLGLLPFVLGWAVWLGAGWAVFAGCVRQLHSGSWALYAACLPALFINALSGQNGPWTAAIFGWGLILLDARPLAAGVVLSLLAFKPQLGFLIPIALVSGWRWRGMAGLLAGGAVQALAVWWAFGTGIWGDYLIRARLLERLVLQGGEGVWHRMFSAFVLVRHLGLGVAASYSIQAVVSVTVAVLVAWTWRRPAHQGVRNTVLVIGALLATPYVTDYDMVVAGLAPLWLWRAGTFKTHPTASRLASVLVIAAPAIAAPMALRTGIAGAGLCLLPALWVAIRGSGNRAGVECQAATRDAGLAVRPSSASK